MALFHATSEAAAFSIDREGQFRPGYHGHLTKNGCFFLLCRHHIILDFWCYVLKCLLDLWHHFSFPRFAPSSRGFAGGAIYFSRSPDGACRKYKNGRGNPEILIECNVQLGRCLEAGKHVIRSREDVQRKGFDSVKIDGLDVSLFAI